MYKVSIPLIAALCANLATSQADRQEDEEIKKKNHIIAASSSRKPPKGVPTLNFDSAKAPSQGKRPVTSTRSARTSDLSILVMPSCVYGRMHASVYSCV